jgi:23S rRNA pseudouridine1911/1915/1917 synthase
MEKLTFDRNERERVDSFLASFYKEYSRAYFQKLIDKKARGGAVLVNDKEVSSSYKLKNGDIVSVEFADENPTLEIKPQNIDLNIVYEDADIIVVNKPPDIVVHPSYGHPDGTLLNALLGYAAGRFTPFLVHRLDKDTSGLIIFAKNEKSKISLSKQFQNRAVKKIYYAAVKGNIFEKKGRIEAPLGRSPDNRKIMSVSSIAKKHAISEFKVLARKAEMTLLEVRIITGRTHQIRSHLKFINHPVIGDKQYGGPETVEGKVFGRQMLHSAFIAFTHPKTSKPVEFSAPLPKDMKDIFYGIL